MDWEITRSATGSGNRGWSGNWEITRPATGIGGPAFN